MDYAAAAVLLETSDWFSNAEFLYILIL